MTDDEKERIAIEVQDLPDEEAQRIYDEKVLIA